MQNKGQYKGFVIGTIVVALIIAVLGLFPQPNFQMYAAYATHFFVGLLPVLGVAGLLKYIACCGSKCKCCDDTGTCGTKGSCN